LKIGLRIKERRKRIGMSAEELGKRLGKDRSTIYRYEKGDIENLPLVILEPIATALGTTPQYLMGWEEEMKKNPITMAERHFEILTDEDFVGMFEDFKTLDAAKRKIVKDLVHSLAETKGEV
jgi:transcriptional regulator with XRE-family HTH domain